MERNQQWSYLLQNMQPGDKKFWKLSCSLRGKRKNKIPHLQVGTHKIITDKEKAESLASTFARSHLLTANYQHPSEARINQTIDTLTMEAPNTENVEFITVNELRSILSTLKTSKSPGLDEIPNILLKRLPLKAVQILTIIFNRCIRLNYFPSAFKKAKIVAVHKPGKPKNECSSYRPISLLSNLGKLFEKCIHNRITEFVSTHELIAKEQFGFKKGHSTIHQVKRIQN